LDIVVRRQAVLQVPQVQVVRLIQVVQVVRLDIQKVQIAQVAQVAQVALVVPVVQRDIVLRVLQAQAVQMKQARSEKKMATISI